MESIKERKAKQRIGNHIFLIYSIIFGTLLTLAFQKKVPVLNWEEQPYSVLEASAKLLETYQNLPYILATGYVIVIFSIFFIFDFYFV